MTRSQKLAIWYQERQRKIDAGLIVKPEGKKNYVAVKGENL